MIDWWNLLFSLAWLSGLSVILAGVSYFNWRASATQSTFRAQFRRETFQLVLWAGLTLIAVGLAGTAGRGWEPWLLGAVAILSAGQAMLAARALRSRQRIGRTE